MEQVGTNLFDGTLFNPRDDFTADLRPVRNGGLSAPPRAGAVLSVLKPGDLSRNQLSCVGLNPGAVAELRSVLGWPFCRADCAARWHQARYLARCSDLRDRTSEEKIEHPEW